MVKHPCLFVNYILEILKPPAADVEAENDEDNLRITETLDLMGHASQAPEQVLKWSNAAETLMQIL